MKERTTVESAALAFWMVGNSTSGDAMACVIVIAALVDNPCSAAVVPLTEFVSVMFPPDTEPAAKTIDDLAPTVVA